MTLMEENLPREARKTPVPVGNDAVPIDNTKVTHRHLILLHDYHNELSVPCFFSGRAAYITNRVFEETTS